MRTLIHKFSLCVLALVILTANISAQTRYSALFTSGNSLKPAWLDKAVSDAVIINLDRSQLQQIISRNDNNIRISFPLENNIYTEAELEINHILVSSSRIVAGTVTGDNPVDISGKFVSYMGKLSGVPGSMVSVTFTNNGVIGLVTGENDTYVISRMNNSAVSNHIIYRTSKLKVSNDFKCGTEAFEIPEMIKQLMGSLKGNFNRATSTFLSANIAIESDYETFVRYGSVENASTYLLALMSTVSAVYIRDINCRLIVTYIRVWNTPADPYNGTTSGALLNEFRNYWNANMQSVPRALAHYISTRSGNLGGIAWLNSLCASVSGGYGYAFSNINGNFNELPVYSWDVDVVSHETGHNFGSPHTHNCGWVGGPIDTCYAVEGGCYSGPTHPRIGTIMSYCHLSAGKTLDFSQQPIELIRSRAENAACFGNIPGYLLAKPNGREIYRSGNNALIIWGTSSTGNVNIEYTTNNGGTWISIQNNVNATLRNITWQIPYIPTTTQAKVRVSESGNPGANDVSDTVFQIRPLLTQFNMISPAQFERFYVTPNDTSTINFLWTKTGTLPEIKYKWFLTSFSNAPIYNQYSNNNGSDTVLTLTRGKIDSIISAYGINTGDSLRGKWQIRAYSQLDSAFPSTTNVIITFIRGLIGINPISNIIPKEFFVNQNYPNPFNPATKIKFGLPKTGYVTAKVYNILGKEISVLADGKLNAGEYEIDWNAENLPSGVYFVKIQSGSDVKILRSVLIK